MAGGGACSFLIASTCRMAAASQSATQVVAAGSAGKVLRLSGSELKPKCSCHNWWRKALTTPFSGRPAMPLYITRLSSTLRDG